VGSGFPLIIQTSNFPLALVRLIETHKLLTAELLQAIEDGSNLSDIRRIDTRLAQLNDEIRNTKPALLEETRMQVEFFMDRLKNSDLNTGFSDDLAALQFLFERLLEKQFEMETGLQQRKFLANEKDSEDPPKGIS